MPVLRLLSHGNRAAGEIWHTPCCSTTVHSTTLSSGHFVRVALIQEKMNLSRPALPQHAHSLAPSDVVHTLLDPLKLRPEELQVAERICAQWVTLEDILDAAAGPREPIGELLLKAGRINRAQLDQALEEQHRSGDRLGQVLIRNEWLTEPELSAVLAFQARLDTVATHAPGPLQLGSLLVAAGDITAEQLQDAVARQRKSKKRIGETLVASGYITEKSVVRGLSLQRALLGVALTAALATSMTPGKASAAKGTSSASMRISATVAPYTHLDVLAQAKTLTVTADDVKRGYVDVSAGTHLMARSNDPNGFLVSFTPRAGVFDSAKITGLGNDVEIDRAGGSVHRAYTGREASMQLGYRFVLSRDVPAGDYPWPLQISAAITY